MRRNTRKVDIIIIAVIVLLTAGGILLALLSDNDRQGGADITADMDGDGKITYTDYIGKRVGILTGSSFEEPTFDFLPDSEYLYYDTLSDLILALQQDKIDCFICDEPIIRMAHLEQPDVGYLSEVLRKDYYSFTFPKNSERSDRIMAQFNEMMAELTSDGTLEKMINKWFSEGSGANRVDFSGLTGENGTLKIATVSTNVPFSMVADGELTGYSIELVSEFCRRYGYDCTIDQTTVASALAGVSTGIYDILASCATVTEERKESMNFCEPIYEGGIALAVKTSDISGTDSSEPSVSGFNGKRAGAADDTGSGQSWFEGIAASFEKNFIREDRWKLILEGIGTTCLITVLSAVFGSVLGFLICMFRRTGSRLANAISDIYVKLLQGTPIVVLLMILYYILLGKIFASVWVAIIGFSLNFGAYASEIMRSGIGSIDGGQREAALALGYNENQAFFKFIFPQAAVRFIPVYKQEIVSLLKSTSIVGYIAIQDLTKMSDIIRSRTYEAFFPLIATAVIYFILAWMISLLLKIILNVTDKRHRRAGASY